MNDAPTAAKQKKKRKRKSNSAPASVEQDAKPGLSARRAATRLLSAVIDAKTPMDALTDDAHGHPHYLALEPRDRSLLRAILMTALRHRADIEHTLAQFIDKPLPEGAKSTRHILHIAMAQIFFLDVPDHAAVDLAVDSANADPRAKRFASLVNAVTRRAVRSKEKCLERISHQPANGPQWFADMLLKAYGEDAARQISAAHRHEAPVDLALRGGRADVTEFAEAIGANVLHTRSVRLKARSDAGRDVTQLPGFAQGDFWVQDVGAGIPAMLTGAAPGMQILDACAAPGGKTAQLLDAGANVIALDLSANRLKRLRENIDRLGLAERCQTVCSSLFDYEPEDTFDAVLLDAPCSSTGTIRRHPDVAWVKSDADIVKLADLQLRLLNHAAKWVKPGGTIIFANCSLDPREGEAVATQFLATNQAFKTAPIMDDELPWLADAIDNNAWVRTTPAMLPNKDTTISGIDGFFAARFQKA